MAFVPPVWRGFLVATDGGSASAGAVRVAGELARNGGPAIELMMIEDGLATAIRRIEDRRDALVLFGLGETSAFAGRGADLVAGISGPVLGVPPGTTRAPQRGVLATDFSSASLAAARHALALLPRPADVSVVSVGLRFTRAGPTRILFDAFEDSLRVPSDVSLTRHWVTGQVAPALLRYAADFGADLLVLGRRHRLGPVVREVLGTATCSVLVGPVVS
jgi:nucleotide-binding universal stress UspA family protein